MARAAGVVTFAALTLLLLKPSFTEVDANVALTPSGSKTVGALCGGFSAAVRARVDPAALTESLVVLKHVSCGGSYRTLHLPKANIAGIQAH